MADTTVTEVLDAVEPELFSDYVLNRTAELSAMWSSGIVGEVPSITSAMASGGRLIHMPFWNDIPTSDEDEVLSDQLAGALTPTDITADADIARKLMRGHAWRASELVDVVVGSDPIAAIGDLVAGWWARRMQAALKSILQGIFGVAGFAATHQLDISAEVGEAAVIDAEALLDTFQLLGDAKERLTAILMHSAVETKLAKLDLIDYIEDSEQATGRIPTYGGRRVIVDDGCPVSNGVYTTYVFGEGAIGYAEGPIPNGIETARESLAGMDLLISRRHFVLHPRGLAWQENIVTGLSPTNAELATAANWSQVYEDKQIRIAALVHRIEPSP